MESFEPKEYIQTTSPIVHIECAESFNKLTEKEKKFCYYYSKACWAGQRLCFFERSYESPALMILLKILFTQDMNKLRSDCIEHAGFTEDDWSRLITYSAAVFNNAGNFTSFGDTKFIPQLPKNKFLAALQVCQNYTDFKDVVDSIWSKIEHEIYSETSPYLKLGFYDDNKTTAYYSSNLLKEEIELANRFLEEESSLKYIVAPLNTRLIKHDDGILEIRVASSSKSPDASYLKTYEFEGRNIKITTGDLSFIIDEIIYYLKYARFYAANDRQKKVLDKNIEHFTSGELLPFREAMTEWIFDKDPVIETEIGFQELYVDPCGVRGEFEGLCAIVDKDESKCYSELVDNAEVLLEKFPWSKEFENEVFQKPNFTCLRLVSHASSGTPLGQNLPNFDDIRMEHGFKNYCLVNAQPPVNSKTIQFVKEENTECIIKHSNNSINLKIALHELLGHGSGKLFIQSTETQKYNFDKDKVINPLTNDKILTWYMSNETYPSKFKKMHSAYEECRADTTAMYLSHFKEPYEIMFAGKEDEWDDIHYTMWHEVIRRGLFGLSFYDEESQTWGQAHVQGNYVIMRVIFETESCINIDFTEKDGKEYFYFSLNRDKIKTDGHEAIKKFLLKLHIYKCLADSESAYELFGGYSQVNDYFLKIREIVLKNKMARRLELQGNLFLNTNKKVEYKTYEETHEGIVRSYIERSSHILDVEMYSQWLKDAEFFRVKQ